MLSELALRINFILEYIQGWQYMSKTAIQEADWIMTFGRRVQRVRTGVVVVYFVSAGIFGLFKC